MALHDLEHRASNPFDGGARVAPHPPSPRVLPRELQGRARLVYARLEKGGDWVSTAELQVLLGLSGGALRPVLDQLVRHGLVERGPRRTNAARSGSLRTWRAVRWSAQ